MKNLFIYGYKHEIIALQRNKYCYLLEGRCIGKFENDVLYKLTGEYVCDLNYNNELWINPANKEQRSAPVDNEPCGIKLTIYQKIKIKHNKLKTYFKKTKKGNPTERVLVMGTRHLEQISK